MTAADHTSPLAPIEGVVFDFDGTLYPLGPLRRYVTLRLIGSLQRLRRYTAVRAALAGEDHGSRAGLFAATLSRLADDPTEQERWAKWIHERYDPTVLAGIRRAAKPRPGLVALLTALRRARVRLGLVSDYTGIDERLSAMGVSPDLFDLRLESEAFGAMKPAPRLASLTMEGLGVRGERLWVIGDRAFTDQRFAEALGARFRGVCDRAPPDPTFAPWSEIARELERLASQRNRPS